MKRRQYPLNSPNSLYPQDEDLETEIRNIRALEAQALRDIDAQVVCELHCIKPLMCYVKPVKRTGWFGWSTIRKVLNRFGL